MARPARVLAVSGALVAAGVLVVGGTAYAAVGTPSPDETYVADSRLEHLAGLRCTSGHDAGRVEIHVDSPERGSGIRLTCMTDDTVTAPATTVAPTRPPRPTTRPAEPTRPPAPLPDPTEPVEPDADTGAAPDPLPAADPEGGAPAPS